MKKILFFCYCMSLNCFAQKEAYQWVFADSSGIDFNNNVWFKSSLYSFAGFEGVASIADSEGNLLFYTGGGKAWNKKHQIMINGAELFGSVTTTQTIIIPQPNSSRYYIFTASPQFDDGFRDKIGFYYSIVDMSLADGLGAVVEKNILLFQNTTEKMTATRHDNGIDYWLVAHEWGNNCFHSYLIDQDGLQTVPVLSCIGSIHKGINVSNTNAIGQMKISPNGKMIACVLTGSRILEVAYFNNKTGKVTQIQSLDFEDAQNLQEGFYGLEFSSDNQKIYFTNVNTALNLSQEIYQIDLSKKKFFNEIYLIEQLLINDIFQLQLAPDKKIYAATSNQSFLSVIENPNDLRATFLYKALSLNMQVCRLGLPNFVSSFLPNEDPDFRFPSVEAYLEMPNAFTPNGDGKNDTFVPIVSENIITSVLTIYNRWGQVVFTNNKEIAWSGENYPAGLYYYHITYTGKDQNTQEAKGWIQLLR